MFDQIMRELPYTFDSGLGGVAVEHHLLKERSIDAMVDARTPGISEILNLHPGNWNHRELIRKLEDKDELDVNQLVTNFKTRVTKRLDEGNAEKDIWREVFFFVLSWTAKLVYSPL